MVKITNSRYSGRWWGVEKDWGMLEGVWGVGGLGGRGVGGSEGWGVGGLGG